MCFSEGSDLGVGVVIRGAMAVIFADSGEFSAAPGLFRRHRVLHGGHGSVVGAVGRGGHQLRDHDRDSIS